MTIEFHRIIFTIKPLHKIVYTKINPLQLMTTKSVSFIHALLAIALIAFVACDFGGDEKVKISTPQGDIIVQLYDETPKHKDNFLKLVKEGYYDGTLFHRCIANFMIQGGDPDSRNAAPGQMLGQGGPGYTLESEIGAIHKRGALAAARLGDAGNPERASNGSQFFIVQGFPVNEANLDAISQQFGTEYTEEDKAIYTEVGGRPDLDGQYTVFGEVVEGMDVIDKILSIPVDQNKRPLQDVSMEMEIIK